MKKIPQKTEYNWYIPFKNSLEVKQSIEKKLKLPFLERNLARKIAEGQVPLVSAELSTFQMPNYKETKIIVTATFTNESKVALFLLKFGWETNFIPSHNMDPMNPNSKKKLSQAWLPERGYRANSYIVFEYCTYDGLIIEERHLVRLEISAAREYITGIDLVKRDFKIGSPIEIGIIR